MAPATHPPAVHRRQPGRRIRQTLRHLNRPATHGSTRSVGRAWRSRPSSPPAFTPRDRGVPHCHTEAGHQSLGRSAGQSYHTGGLAREGNREQRETFSRATPLTLFVQTSPTGQPDQDGVGRLPGRQIAKGSLAGAMPRNGWHAGGRPRGPGWSPKRPNPVLSARPRGRSDLPRAPRMLFFHPLGCRLGPTRATPNGLHRE
jgi:hypothetical protein